MTNWSDGTWEDIDMAKKGKPQERIECLFVILWTGAVVNQWRCHKTSACGHNDKVRHDFKIITDVISCVSLVTSNIRGSSICSPKSLYKKTSDEILGQSWRQLSKVVKGSGGPNPSYPSLLWPICCDRRVSNSQLSHTPRHHREEGRRRNFSICSDHTWIKTTSIFSSLTFEFEYFFFCRLLSLQHKTLVLWYILTVSK